MDTWQPPSEFDGYRLVRSLGQGGMGHVYLGKDLLLDRSVAIKFIAAAEISDALEERFLAEGRALARLAHPNVVAVHRVSQIHGRPYLVSEYVRGESLDAIRGPIPWERALRIGVGLARGLAAAHRHGVLHRDIKPSNVVLGDDGEVKLLDFGIAKIEPVISGPSRVTGEGPVASPGLGEGGAATNRTTAELATGGALPGRPAGTPLYMAPEVLEGEPASRRSDLYSFGAVLYELCSGGPPRRDGAQSSIPPLETRAPGVHPRLAEIVGRCLETDPLRRYASADEVLDALEHVAPTHQIVALPASNPYRGLRSFDSEHRALFFGREADIGAVLDRLRTDPLVVVAGDSGVGKSSLCRAGVLPLVVERGLDPEHRWVIARLVPGRDPLLRLATVLAPVLRTEADALAAWLRAEPAALARAVQRERQTRPELGIVVFVDQAEELLSVASAEEAARFSQCCSLSLSLIGGLRWLMAIRGDFVARLAALPGLGDELQRSLYFLRPLSPELLREAIVGPVRAHGVTFESERLVENLVLAGQAPSGSLPLLQFALSELWESRDQRQNKITTAALEAIGGVNGALAQHADAVLAGLSPAERDQARRILVELVNSDGTRARRTLGELRANEPVTAKALDALIEGRLVVARTRAGETEFELAHESLPRIWPALSEWLDKTSESRRARQRVHEAAVEWGRLGRSPDALWHRRQLEELRVLGPQELEGEEERFLEASRRRARSEELLPWGLAAGVVGLMVLAVLVTHARSRAALAERVEAQMAQARASAGEAHAAGSAAQKKRVEALGLFDGTWRHPERGSPVPEDVRWDEAEATWADALPLQRQADAAYSRASTALELALMLDPDRRALRSDLAGILFEQLQQNQPHARSTEELRERLAAFDTEGRFRKELEAVGSLELTVNPPMREVRVERYATSGGLLRPELVRTVGASDRTELALGPGSYRLVLVPADGGPSFRYPFVLQAGEKRVIDLRLPSARSIPRGFVYIPPGPFLMGSADDETLRIAQMAPPMHEVQTPGFLISETEVTFAEWAAFLDSGAASLPEHRPDVESTKGLVRMIRGADGWTLHLRPTSKEYVARWGQPVRYEGRDRLSVQDWRRFPVTGISLVDIQDYLRWLDRSGRVPGARLCTEWEWERAARGADGRTFSTGDTLPASMVNVDLTYGRNSVAFGPDEVGSHPESDSPFGLHDVAGNALEVVSGRGPGEAASGRGGCWYFDAPFSARLTSHEPLESQTRAVYLGFRVCAPL
jgi:serine/threonine protein kinase/formylglycine-generating enzyme required for sulfatase activity